MILREISRDSRLAEWVPPGSLAFVGGCRRIIGQSYDSVGALTYTGTVNESATERGIGVHAATSGSYVSLGKVREVANPSGLTYVAVINRGSDPGARYIAGTVDTGTAYIEDFAVNLNSAESNVAGHTMIQFRNAGGQSRIASTAAVIEAGRTHTVVWQYSSGGNARLYLDGRQIAITVGLSAASYSGVPVLCDFPLVLGNRNVRNAFSNGGGSLTISLFARIPQSRIDGQALSARPAMLFEQPRTYFIPEVVAPGGFQAAWARNANTIIQAAA